MKQIIIDLEGACCDNGSIDPSNFEIIEIGAVVIDENNNYTDMFQSFIRPTITPILTEFCKTLTHINQEDIEKAEKFEDVWHSFYKWMYDNHYPFQFCSWGMYDQEMFIKELNRCPIYRIPNEFQRINHVNVASVYKNKCGGRSQRGALKRFSIKRTGIHHRAIDDAHVIAKIMQRLNEIN